jgi:hypothetical protein
MAAPDIQQLQTQRTQLESREAELRQQLRALEESENPLYRQQRQLNAQIRAQRTIVQDPAATAAQKDEATARATELEQQYNQINNQLRITNDQREALARQILDVTDQLISIDRQIEVASQGRSTEPAPAATVSQQVSQDAGDGPTQPPPQITPGPTNADSTPTLADGGGDSGTDAPTRTFNQTQTVGSSSAPTPLRIEITTTNRDEENDDVTGGEIPSETGAQLPPPRVLPGTANTSGTGASRPGAAAGEDTGAQLPPSSATRPPAVTGGLSTDSKITPQPNILDKFANYTYQAAVYLMSDEQYRTYLRTGKRTVTGYNLLFQSGGAAENQGGAPGAQPQSPQQAGAPAQPSNTQGRNPNFPLDYYIDSITIENLLPGKSTQSAHSVRELKFTVVEPANISLIDNIYKAVQEIKPKDAAGAVNYAAAHYLMVIRFYGYDQNGVIQKVGAADPVTGQSDPNAVIEKFIPFKIKDIAWSVSNKLVTYEFQCAVTDQMIALGTRRGSVPADVELSGGTVREILAGGVIYSGTPATTEAPGSATTATSNQTDAESARLNRQAGNAPPTATRAPQKATAAPSKTAIKQGLMQAMNDMQKQLVKDGVYEVADEYVLEFAPGAESIADATITKPGEKTDKSQTPVGPAPSQQASTLSPDKQSMASTARNQTIVAGMQLIQAIDIVVRNSNYITNQAQVQIRDDTSGSQTNPASGRKGVNWFNVTFRAEPLKYDNKRNDYAYRVTYIVSVFPVQDFLSLYFPLPLFRGLHKSYPYWFTGINTAVLDYTATFNKLYSLTVTSSTPNFDALAKTREKYTSNMRDMAFFQYQARSTESQQNTQSKANELAANAAEYLYNTSDNANAKLRILGDPAWIAQGSFTGAVSAETFTYSPFLPDGTINFDSNDVLFEIVWQRPEDYDINTGLADPYSRTSKLYGDRQPRQSVVYRATTVESEFRQGRFEQTVNGTLYQFPLPDGRNAAPAVYRGTQTEGDEGEAQARQNFAQQQAQAQGVNRANAASPSSLAAASAAVGAAGAAVNALPGAVARGVTDLAGAIPSPAIIPGFSEAARIAGYGNPGAISTPIPGAVNLLGVAASTARTPGAGLPSVLPSLPPAAPSSNGQNVGLAPQDIQEAERIQAESGDAQAITPQQVANNRLINERLSSVFGQPSRPQTIARET